MTAFWNKPKKESGEEPGLTWDPAATQGVEQALTQAPVPKALRGRLKKELRKAAEEAAREDGATHVKPEHLMSGMLAKMPENMRSQIEEAMRTGNTAQLENLKKKFG